MSSSVKNEILVCIRNLHRNLIWVKADFFLIRDQLIHSHIMQIKKHILGI